MSEKILLIDGHSILNRAFYGLPDLTNSEGKHTGAVYGFLNILLRTIEEEKPQYLTVAFDLKAPTFRHKMFEAYKGTRKPMPEELREQVPLIKEMLTAMGVNVVTKEGYEADDILGTLARKSEAAGMDATILSGDRDLLQLATDKVMIRLPKTVRGKTPEHKDEVGSGAYDPNGIVQKALREAKKQFPDMYYITDVCMCEYTSHGHCGVLCGHDVNNDATLELLAKTAVSHVEAGADMVAPSDMMDGRVRAIREALDANGHYGAPIMSYAVKYASAFYGPFRDAAGSAPSFGDRKSYQMDFHNRREGMKEALTDVEEGADIIMVKPAMSYLDMVSEVSKAVNVPVATYSVSGEYAMVKAAAKMGWIDEERIMCEMAVSAYRAGAQIYLTYYAKELAKCMDEGRIG